MRTRTGKTNSTQFHEIITNSRLHELDSHHMTSREMEIDQRVINTLKAKEVIKECGRVKGLNRLYVLWGPGAKYRYYMKRWGWA